MVALGGNYCITSGKECFDSRYLAQKAVDRLNKRASKKGCVYQCPDCGKWHITHYSYQHNKDINSKRKKNMAGKGKFKIGAEVGYVDNLGSPLVCGAYVRHIITGKDGTITQYGVVKGVDGTNYKLCDNFWAVVEHSEPIDINIGDVESEAEELIGEKEEKTLADFSDDELLNEVLQRNFTVKTLAEHGISTYDIPESEDKYLAEELRRRGYEVKAEKTVVVSL